MLNLEIHSIPPYNTQLTTNMQHKPFSNLSTGPTIHVCWTSLHLNNVVTPLAPGLLDQIIEYNASLLVTGDLSSEQVSRFMSWNPCTGASNSPQAFSTRPLRAIRAFSNEAASLSGLSNASQLDSSASGMQLRVVTQFKYCKTNV